ncbi:MAG TPA: transcription antitermination factor NusB [Candidatus Woesebacteria bacterium]|nr:transcription antitermination factor NusB [Candidatus Woesebacteria bacterium]
MDARHEKRIHIIQNLFSKSFEINDIHVSLPNEQFADITSDIFQNTEKIDEIISTHAPKYPLDKIARIDLCILRLAVYELTIEKKEPVKVIINEAVELAKEMGNERSFAFINAVLGAVVSGNPT